MKKHITLLLYSVNALTKKERLLLLKKYTIIYHRRLYQPYTIFKKDLLNNALDRLQTLT